MARDDVNTNNIDNEQEDAEQPTSRFANRWVLLAIAGVVLLALSAGGTLLTIKLLSTPDEEIAESSEEKIALPDKPAIYYPIKPPIVVDFSVRGRQRYVQADLTLMTRDNAVVSAIELHMPMLRNALVLLFSGQDYEELQTAEGKELLRQASLQELRRLVEQEIGRPGIEQVFFINFVMQ